MIKIIFQYSDSSILLGSFFDYIKLYLKTQFNNIGKYNAEYYNTIIICNLLQEVKFCIEKKVLANQLKKKGLIKITLTQPQAIAFTKGLGVIPIKEEDVYCDFVRNKLIAQIFEQIKEPLFD